MGRTARSLLAEALKLSPAERAEVASALLDSLDDSAFGIDPAWCEEIGRRVAEIDAGMVKPISWEDAQRVVDHDDPEA
jgi:putative addiction module component (TIGR02574 family)